MQQQYACVRMCEMSSSDLTTRQCTRARTGNCLQPAPLSLSLPPSQGRTIWSRGTRPVWSPEIERKREREREKREREREALAGMRMCACVCAHAHVKINLSETGRGMNVPRGVVRKFPAERTCRQFLPFLTAQLFLFFLHMMMPIVNVHINAYWKTNLNEKKTLFNVAGH